MKAVVNATPVIALASIDRLDLLRAMFDQVIVPRAVYEEVIAGGARRAGVDALKRADWLRIAAPQAGVTIEPLLLGLDAGELEVLLLGRETNADWVIIDERLGRRVAFAMGLPVKGTLGVLLAAAVAGILSRDEASGCLAQLVGAGIRIGARWQAWFQDELSRL